MRHIVNPPTTQHQRFPLPLWLTFDRNLAGNAPPALWVSNLPRFMSQTCAPRPHRRPADSIAFAYPRPSYALGVYLIPARPRTFRHLHVPQPGCEVEVPKGNARLHQFKRGQRPTVALKWMRKGYVAF
jgi:hypothetical protein